MFVISFGKEFVRKLYIFFSISFKSMIKIFDIQEIFTILEKEGVGFSITLKLIAFRGIQILINQ